jgi:hypothetical protein
MFLESSIISACCSCLRGSREAGLYLSFSALIYGCSACIFLADRILENAAGRAPC